MNIREKLFLVCGNDPSQRSRAIENIKHRIMKGGKDPLGILTLYAPDLEPAGLHEALFTSTFTTEKIVIIKDFTGMNAQARQQFWQGWERALGSGYYIFETEYDHAWLLHSKTVKACPLLSAVVQQGEVWKVSSTPKDVTIDDFMDNLRAYDLQGSLAVLDRLFQKEGSQKHLGPQVIGILVRRCSAIRDESVRQESFRHIWKADRAIKEKGHDTRLVVEALLVEVLAGCGRKKG